jgi:hypothetical protein
MPREPYATTDDVFTLALSASAFVVYGRPFNDIDIQTGTIRLKAHGFSGEDLLTFEALEGGEVPPEISAFQTYAARPLSADLFQIASADEDPIPYFLAAGSGWLVTFDPIRRLQKNLVERAGFIDEHLTAHDPPIERDPITGDYPPALVGMNARLAARQTINSLQFDNAAFRVAVDRLFDSEKFDAIILADWKAGKPIQPRPTDANATADNSARAVSSGLPVEWENHVI